jgi:hypothetical protein
MVTTVLDDFYKISIHMEIDLYSTDLEYIGKTLIFCKSFSRVKFFNFFYKRTIEEEDDYY